MTGQCLACVFGPIFSRCFDGTFVSVVLHPLANQHRKAIITKLMHVYAVYSFGKRKFSAKCITLYIYTTKMQSV